VIYDDSKEIMRLDGLQSKEVIIKALKK